MGLGREGEKERGERSRMKSAMQEEMHQVSRQFGGTVATEPRRLAELWTSASELESGS